MKTISVIIASILLVSCSSPKQHTAEDVLQSSDNYWKISHCETFKDGGSVALGFLNSNGEILYLWANPVSTKVEEQKLYLMLNYNDPNEIEILEGSELEQKVLSILENINVKPYLDSLIPLIEKFKDVLSDRTQKVNQYWDKDAK